MQDSAPGAPLATIVVVIVSLLLSACGGKAKTQTSTETRSSPTTATATEPQKRSVRLDQIGSFEQPLDIVAAPDDGERIFVVEKTGRIVSFDGDQKKTFLNLKGEVSQGSEQGLFGMAFAPDYKRSGRFYVNFTDVDGDTRIQEFKRSSENSDQADRSSRRQIMFVRQPFPNHNGGDLVFGPDNLLYIGLGDGGSANDPQGNAKSTSTLLGKMLRIDPTPAGRRAYTIPANNPFAEKPGARPEICFYGMRNPWRYSVDSETGDMYIGDVGQDALEEIDYVRKADVCKGQNFGWPAFEGNRRIGSGGDDAVPPILDYPLHQDGACAVIGGNVVHDPDLPALDGRYVYGDFCAGFVRSFRPADGKAKDDRPVPNATVDQLSSFGVDGQGHLYAASLEGPVYRFVAAS